MKPITQKEFLQIPRGAIFYLLFTGGGMASPWIRTDQEKVVRHLQTNRTIELTHIGETQRDTRVYLGDPNPEYLTFQEFVDTPEDTWIFYQHAKTQELHYGQHRSSWDQFSNQYFHWFERPNGQKFMPTQDRLERGVYHLWIDMFYERNQGGLFE